MIQKPLMIAKEPYQRQKNGGNQKYETIVMYKQNRRHDSCFGVHRIANKECRRKRED
jgi:hypothetical protein